MAPSQKKTARLLVLFPLSILFGLMSIAAGFQSVVRPSRIVGSDGVTHREGIRQYVRLFAKKAKATKKKKSNKSAVGGGGGGGFGSSTNSNSMDGKVRTVSGFAGSGTKPLRQAANTFDAIRAEHGKEACWDLYCKSPLNDPNRLWFIGKISVTPNTAATPEQAVIAQKRVILEYAKRELRPQNLGGKYADHLELWLAPGDSEMDCVQNKVSLTKVEGSTADLVDDFAVADVGYNPEIYVGDEREKGGLRITRDDNGDPINPVFEVNQSA